MHDKCNLYYVQKQEIYPKQKKNHYNYKWKAYVLLIKNIKQQQKNKQINPKKKKKNT